MGKIELTVCAARKLHDGRLIGLPDPFVRLTTGDKKYKTKVVENSLSPEWDETFRFNIADEMSTQIRFEVWDKHTYNDDLLGYYTLSLGGLTKGIVKDQWYILEKSKTEAELHIRILAVDFGALPKPEEQWMVTTDITRDPVKRAIEDGTWRPGQTTAPPPSGPPQPQQQVYVQPAPVPVQQPQVQYVQPMPVAQPFAQQVQYAPAPPQQVQYVQQPPPQVQYVQQPQYVPQSQPQYMQPQPQPGYYQQGPPQPQGYYQPGPPPPQPTPQGYYAQPPPQGYAPQPYYQY
ncbi:hypothetical protein ABL78_0519 [Leptomonas seymouri]|uniref:C2 domain-containing protein n=1 Tax=Leptomonas seymouri TaxID=5684 RepID=A0A0N1PDS5_LEPSE|nr:hypothetical protein ABL78_0519 [Leptomonas seymouri]|eukprot:KPI90293.1 hypothetical protein ABL78_0519 [Leptomonas seymouri]